MSRLPATTRTARRLPAQYVAYRRLAWVGPLAAAGAVLVNALLFGLGRVTGLISDTVLNPTTQQPLAVSSVITTSIVGVLGATLVYALLGFTRRPIANFRLLATIVLVGSFTTPFTLVGAGDGYRILLLIMHCVTAAFAVVLLTTRARKEPDEDESEEG